MRINLNLPLGREHRLLYVRLESMCLCSLHLTIQLVQKLWEEEMWLCCTRADKAILLQQIFQLRTRHAVVEEAAGLAGAEDILLALKAFHLHAHTWVNQTTTIQGGMFWAKE